MITITIDVELSMQLPGISGNSLLLSSLRHSGLELPSKMLHTVFV